LCRWLAAYKCNAGVICVVACPSIRFEEIVEALKVQCPRRACLSVSSGLSLSALLCTSFPARACAPASYLTHPCRQAVREREFSQTLSAREHTIASLTNQLVGVVAVLLCRWLAAYECNAGVICVIACPSIRFEEIVEALKVQCPRRACLSVSSGLSLSALLCTSFPARACAPASYLTHPCRQADREREFSQTLSAREHTIASLTNQLVGVAAVLLCRTICRLQPMLSLSVPLHAAPSR
jgi:hypothetical protein